jgi:hypothetical protein
LNYWLNSRGLQKALNWLPPDGAGELILTLLSGAREPVEFLISVVDAITQDQKMLQCSKESGSETDTAAPMVGT